jgi:hypothetical protein
MMADKERSRGATRELEKAATNTLRAADQLESLLELTRLVHRARGVRRGTRSRRSDETPAS